MAKIIFVTACLVLASNAKAFLDPSPPNVPLLYRLYAEEARVPAKLFYALILNESRSAVRGPSGTSVLPWPWTINFEGKPHYFGTREEAHRFGQELMSAGEKNFDVGLGQLNWYWQHTRFADLWEAFDPHRNLQEAARILREQYERPECNTWELAVGCYHRPGQRDIDKRYASIYREKVITLWKNI